MRKLFPRFLVLALLASALILLVGVATADTYTTDFESFTVGNVNGQDGWSKTGGFDVAIIDQATLGLSYPGFGSRSLRISNAVTSGSFGDQTFSGSTTNEAGEADAENDGMSGGTRQPYYETSFDFASANPSAEQAGLSVVMSPDRGDGARMGWVQITDTPVGLAVNFYGYDTTLGGTCDDLTNFTFSNIATGLDRSLAHNLKVTMEFVDGINNDVVRVYLNGSLIHTGTSWEDYFRNCQPPGSRTVDSALFRVSGTAAPATSGKGFLIDNFAVKTGSGPTRIVTPLGTTTAVPANVCPGLLFGNWSYGWYACDENSADNSGGVAAVSGPATPPLGTGSAQFTIAANNDGPTLFNAFELGLPLSQLTEIGYSMYWDSSSVSDDLVNFFINVDYDLTDAAQNWQGRLVWVAGWAGCSTLVGDTWQEYDPITNATGCWLQSGTPYVGGASQPAAYPLSGGTAATWAQIMATYPNAGIHPTFGGVGFKMGSGQAATVAAIDDVTLAFDSGSGEISTTWDFEPVSVEIETTDANICDAGSVDISLNNISGLYGYQFKVTYDATKISAVGALDYTWFDSDADGSTPPGWLGDCAAGVCKFARTEQFPDPAVSGSGVVGTIALTSLLPATATTANLQITDLVLTDRNGFAIPAQVGELEVNVCGNTTISGKVSLQGRPWTAGVNISAPGLGFEVKATGPYGTYSTIPSPVDGTYTITGVKYFLPGTIYTVAADHSLYLMAEKTPVTVSAPITGLSTKLFGGDARNDGGVDIGDVGCIGGLFNTAPAPALGTACGPDPLNSPDINADNKVNIQDLSIAGGNFTRPEPTGW